MCVAVVWDRRQFLCECGCCEASFVLRCVIGSWRLGQERAIKFLQLSPTSSLCRDVVFRRVLQFVEVDLNFAELLLSCVGGHGMLCIVARCDGVLIRLPFLCVSGDKVCVAWLRARVRGVFHFAILSWVLRLSPPHIAASGAINCANDKHLVEHHNATKSMPRRSASTLHQNCRCLC